MNRYLFYALFIVLAIGNCRLCFSQVYIELSDVLQYAKLNSVEYRTDRDDFLAGYWEYRMSKIKYLPKIDFNTNPFSINRSVSERYDFDRNIEVFRESKMLSTSTNVSVSQAIPYTGGIFSLGSNMSRIVNLGEPNLTSYSVTPVRISYSQPLFASNSFKWDKEIVPLKLLIAKQRLIQSEQNLYVKVISFYFNLVMSFHLFEFAKQDLENAENLYKSGQELFKLNSITHNNLIELELKKTNAEIFLAEKSKQLKKARYELNKFLPDEITPAVQPHLNEKLPWIEIIPDDAIRMAQKSNPFYFEIEKELLNLQRNLDQLEKQKRFSANFSVSYGLNQSGNSIAEAFRKPLNQQSGSISLSIPIYDGGAGSGNLRLAKIEKETAILVNQEAISDFEQSLVLKVFDYNLQPALVRSSVTAKDLSSESYATKMKQFAMGKINITELNYSQMSMLQSNENYIDNIRKFWEFYYELQAKTLHDLKTGKELSVDFEKLIELINN